VRRAGREGLFDDVAGRGFMVVWRGASPLETLPADALDFFLALGGHFVEIAVPGTSRDTGLDDRDGRYRGLMDALGCDVLLKRPDFYLFGACRKAADLPALMQDMRAQLGR